MRKLFYKIAIFFLFFWELPQNLAGLFLIYIVNIGKKKIRMHDGFKAGSSVFFLERGCPAGVCLGEFICFPYWSFTSVNKTDKQHERGHRVQSRILGPLYLILVGIPSLFRNLSFRRKQRNQGKYSFYKLVKWYYHGYPENWADKLGNVSGRKINGVKI